MIWHQGRPPRQAGGDILFRQIDQPMHRCPRAVGIAGWSHSRMSPPRQVAIWPFSAPGDLPEATSRRISANILMLDSATAGSTCFLLHTGQEDDMPDSVYKVIELVGTSNDSWEKAAANAVEQAAKSLRDLRVAEVVKLDLQLDAKGKVEAYRAKLNVSFKFEGS
jgi:flavin-binding protein dodecin